VGTGDAKFSIGRVTRFYVPLLLQAFSQSLTYPLVAGIVTHGALGVNALTAFNQGQMIMFMIGALGGGLVMTGMVFAKTRHGYREFRRLNTWMMVGLLALQCIPALPPLCDWIFRGLFALPPHLALVARRTLVLGVVMNAAFFLRNVPMVVLFNNLESGKANNATFIRILVTLACSAAFPRFGLTGPDWGLFALTLGVIVETVVTWWYARPFVRDLPECEQFDLQSSDSLFTQLRFTVPLSLGGFLLMFSPLFIASFIGRTANAADMLVITYVTLGVANPVAYGALRMQAVSIKFPPEYPGDRRLLAYAICAGLLLGLIPLVFSTPLVGNWYFGSYQNVPERILATARLVIGIYALIPIVHAVRGRIEGTAARLKSSRSVMAGQIAYTITLACTLSILLPLGVPGWAMAQTAIFLAPMSAALAIYLMLARRK